MPSGLIIAFEGIDGTGKSTNIELLRTVLKRKNYDVVVTANNTSPYVASGPIKHAKKEYLLSPTMLTMIRAVDLYDRYEREVTPGIARGAVVMADRWIWSMIAREGARGIDQKWIKEIYSKVPPADLIVYLDLKVQEGLRRSKQKGDDHPRYYEAGNDVNPHMSRDQSYVSFMAQEQKIFEGLIAGGKPPSRVVDANRPLHEVQAKIQSIVLPYLAHLPK